MNGHALTRKRRSRQARFAAKLRAVLRLSLPGSFTKGYLAPRRPSSMGLFGGINKHRSSTSNPTSDRGKRQSAGSRKVSYAVGSRPWPPYLQSLSCSASPRKKRLNSASFSTFTTFRNGIVLSST